MLNLFRIRKGDTVLVGILLLSAVILYWALPILMSCGNWVVIICNDKPEARYLLDIDQEISVIGVMGETKVSIRNGRAKITESPCRNKLCTLMGDLGKEGGALVCVPNKVVVTVSDDNMEGVDAISR